MLVKYFFFHLFFKREKLLRSQASLPIYLFAATGVLFLWKMSLICIGHLKMNILFCSLLALVA